MNAKRFLGGMLFLTLLSPLPALAGGFMLYEQGSAASGQSAAFVARAYDASAIYYNPAGLGWQDGLSLYVGTSFIIPTFSYTSPEGVETEPIKKVFVTPNFYGSYKPLDWFAFGLGTFAGFGLGIEWPEGWEGVEKVQASNLTTYTINPTVAFMPHETISIGAGFDVIFASLEMSQGLYPGQSAGLISLGGSTVGFGGNAGVLWCPLSRTTLEERGGRPYQCMDSWFSLGLAYRSAMVLNAEGRVDFDVDPALASAFPDQDMSTSVTLPHVLVPAVAFMPAEWLSLEVDLEIVFWNSFENLTFDFKDAPSEKPPEGGLYDKVIPEEWKIGTVLRVGVEGRPGLGFRLRAGYIYDPCQVPDETLNPSLPDGDRHDFSVGVGWNWEWLSIDAYYMAVILLENTVTEEVNEFPGSYAGLIHLMGMHVGLNF